MGRKARADQPSTKRLELLVTLDEFRQLHDLARANGHASLSDMLRLGVLVLADDSGLPAPVNLSQELTDRIVDRELQRRANTRMKKARRVPMNPGV